MKEFHLLIITFICMGAVSFCAYTMGESVGELKACAKGIVSNKIDLSIDKNKKDFHKLIEEFKAK